ncbi:hypothetical protein D8674_017812 [Pyrus ussuriensis x Pyrus communis]|uniref:Integrase catalytic domain-containing protein n=1 Tax=Pyrus ussuriensis x Pyrus communis TaxID=2448454 RepID=A0A5N5HJ42_9ROSA|nr:hypothetical protein D8674_017812 [Pyrus ussuriensis x Pyrus communis]
MNGGIKREKYLHREIQRKWLCEWRTRRSWLKEYWSLIETGYEEPAKGAQPLSEARQKKLDAMKLKDLKAKNYLFQAIDRSILETMLEKDTSKKIWDSMKTKYEGNARVKHSTPQALRRDFETLEMKVVCSIEESRDLDAITIDELQSSLTVHEQKFHRSSNVEQVLKVTTDVRTEGSSSTYRGRGRGRSNYRGRGRGRGGQVFNKDTVEFYKCHNLGHFQYECPKWEKEANYADVTEEDDMLLMAFLELPEQTDAWFLNSGCSNHMCGSQGIFTNLDETFVHSVKLGNNSRMNVVGKGSVKLFLNGITHIVHEVYYVPELKNNLLSIGQLQERGLTILIQEGVCKIYHPTKGLIIQTEMSRNRMFILRAQTLVSTNVQPARCLHTSTQDLPYLWHRRYGHLTHKGLRILQQKKMVRGLPQFQTSNTTCTVCIQGKQHRTEMPTKSTWRASQPLELIHADICGPISPTSNSGKRGGEFTSTGLVDFCKENGIKRQLTTTYTPQQNGVAERKNQTVMNMVRSMLSEKKLPKTLWPEAVNWAIYVLNRCPTLAVKDITPQEAWSGIKPTVEHLRVFGSLAHVHVPDVKRGKLDDKSFTCILLGVSEESKGYRLFDPIAKKIIVSRDVIFEEEKQWDWDVSYEGQIMIGLEWGENEENGEEEEGVRENENGSEAREERNVGESSVGERSESSEETQDELGEDEWRVYEGRVRRPPSYLSDYVTGEGLSDDEAHMVQVVPTEDPIRFEEAVKEEKWRQAMDSEISSIEKNKTWSLSELPTGAKRIGVNITLSLYSVALVYFCSWSQHFSCLYMSQREGETGTSVGG